MIPRNGSNELRVFISSTFRDLQEEREHLVKKIFPEMIRLRRGRALCRERGITFTEVDLRWGLTDEQATLGTVIRVCLEEVDKCRPYFLGMLGNRYGWAPDLHEVLIDPDLLARYPWVEDAAIDGKSLTEMEFMHGVLDAGDQTGDCAYFYHRPDASVESDDRAKLAQLIRRVREGNYPLREFTNSEQLGLLVRDDLRRAIDRHWPQDEAPTPVEIERRAHAAFAASRRRAYIPNPSHLKQFNRWIAEGTTPLVISARSGLGKSALAAFLCESYRARNPNAVIIEHYVGTSEESGSALSLARRLVQEIREQFAIDDLAPTDPQKLLSEVPGWLWRLSHLAAEQGRSVLVVLDALNQLDADGQRLTWLPSTVPENLKLLITATPGDALDALHSRSWDRLELQPIQDDRVRQSIVLRYLGEFHKGITSDQVRQITEDPKASYPLYLRVVAEELRLHGEHETLGSVISGYVAAQDLSEVFQRMLERMETDFDADSVREVLTFIWTTRSGLAETDLLSLTGMSRLELSRLLFAFDYHLLQKNGLLGFFHDYLRRAVEQRYLNTSSARNERYQRLANHFESAEVTVRSSMEALHALEMLSDDDRLRSILSDLDRFLELWQFEQQSVLRLWSGTDLSVVTEAYRSSRVKWLQRVRSTNEQFATQFTVGELLYRLGAWTDAAGWYRACEKIAREMDDLPSIARAVGNLGIVYWSLGEHDAALNCFVEQEQIARKLGDRESIATAVGSRGNIHWSRGQFHTALTLYQEQETIARQIGDRARLSLAIGNLGLAHLNLGDVDRALACFREQETIARELGNGHSLVLAVGNIANVYQHRQQQAEALDCYLEQEKIARELGDRQNHGIARGNRALVHEARREYGEALDCFQKAAREHRDMGFRYGLTYWLEGIARVLLLVSAAFENMPEYVPAVIYRSIERGADTGGDWKTVTRLAAREFAEECVAISEDISKPDTQRRGRLLLAQIDAATGHSEAARTLLLQLLHDASDDGNRGTFHYWLWKTSVDDATDHRREALRLLTSIPANQQSREMLMYIEEMTGDVRRDDAG